MRTRSIPLQAACVCGILLATAAAATAQQRQGTPPQRPRIYIDLLNPFGQPVTQDQDRFRYIVPSTARHGTYYTHENHHYYTPPVRRGPGQPPVRYRPAPLVYGAFGHVDELADRLETLANEFCVDLYYNYRHNRGFDTVYREAYQFLQATKYIHDREHRGDRDAIRRSAADIDNLFHHVQEDIHNWTPLERRRVGQFSLQGKTEELEALIHHLMFDLGVQPDHDRHGHDDRDRRPGRRDDAPPPPGRRLPRAPG